MKDRVVTAMGTDGGFLLARFSWNAGRLRAEAVESVTVPAAEGGPDALRGELRRLGFGGLPAVLVLGPRDTYVHFHRPSVRAPAAVRNTILYELEGELPVPVEELVFDYAAGASAEDPVLFAAALRSSVASQVGALRGMGMAPVQAIPSVACVADAWATCGEATGDGGVLCIHLGERGVDLLRLDGEFVSRARAVPDEGGTEGLRPGDGLPPLARSFLVEAAIEGVRSFAISGDRERAGRVAEEVGREYGMKPVYYSLDGLAEGLSQEGRDLLSGRGAPLVGAALQYFSEPPPLSLNLLPVVGQASMSVAALRLPVRVAGVLLLVLLLCWAVSGALARHRVQGDLTAAGARLAALWKDLHPGEAPPPDPVRTLRGELASYSEHGGGQGAAYPALDVLRRLVQLGEGQEVPYTQVKVTAGTVELEGEAASYAAVDGLAADLERQGLKALPAEMESQGGRAKFRLVLQTKGGPGP